VIKNIGRLIMHAAALISAILILIVIGFATYEGLLLYKHDMNPDYAVIDRCLDKAGAWDYNKRVCQD